MAKTKSKGKVKKASRTGSNKAGKSQNFSWVFIAIGVIAVVVTGVLVVRFSNASTVQNYKLNVKTAVGGPDEVTTQLTFSGFATLNRVGLLGRVLLSGRALVVGVVLQLHMIQIITLVLRKFSKNLVQSNKYFIPTRLLWHPKKVLVTCRSKQFGCLKHNFKKNEKNKIICAS